MFRRKKTEPSPAAAASLERAIRDADEQRAKLEAEMPLRARLRQIRAENHLAQQLYEVLSERRGQEGSG
jgi:hypothetical protein